jgi:hypothetical protein
MTRTTRRLTEDERAQRRARERELTARAVAQLRTSPGWQAWLRVRSRTGLRRYSLRNQLLVAVQDPDATRVAGFRAWLSLGYCVRKGETCRIRVWARCEPSRKKLQAWRDAGADPATKPKAFYRLEPVFDTLSRDMGRVSNSAVARLSSESGRRGRWVAAARVRSPVGATSPCRRAPLRGGGRSVVVGSTRAGLAA